MQKTPIDNRSRAKAIAPDLYTGTTQAIKAQLWFRRFHGPTKAD